MTQWTVSVTTDKGQRLVSSHDVKRDAVNAVMAIREPKTPIYRNGRDYVCMEKKAK